MDKQDMEFIKKIQKQIDIIRATHVIDMFFIKHRIDLKLAREINKEIEEIILKEEL